MTRWLPTWPTFAQPAFSKALAASLPEMLASVPMHQEYGKKCSKSGANFGCGNLGRYVRCAGFLDGDEQRGLILWKCLNGFLIFGPHPGCDRFPDILNSLFFISALRYAAGKCGTLGDDPSVFCGFESNVEGHAILCKRILTSVMLNAHFVLSMEYEV